MSRPEELLKRLAGPDARFREHQLEAITDLVDDRARVLCVQRTGWGKSAVYFLATSLLREQGAGPALIVSPLLALMRNQIAAAEKLGIRAHTINSTNRDGWDEVARAARGGRRRPAADQPRAAQQPAVPATRCCRCSPSASACWWSTRRTASPTGATTSGPTTGASQDMIERLPEGVAVLCTTATANDRVVADVAEQLQLGHAGALKTYRGPLGRKSLRLEVVELPAQADRLAWLATHLPTLPGSGIVYTLTKRDADTVAEWLNGHGVPAEAYSGEVDTDAADRGRGAAAQQRPQGRRRHERARDGLRQARPRLRRALPGARLGHLLLPAGRPRGARDRARRRRAAARPRGPPDPGLLHRAGVPAQGPRRPRARGDRGRRDDQRADGRRQPRQEPDRGDAEGARRRGRGRRATARAGCACPAATGTTTATATRT